MVKPPSEHFQFSQKWTIFGSFEDKKFPKATGTIYIKCVLPKYIVLKSFWPHFC